MRASTPLDTTTCPILESALRRKHWDEHSLRRGPFLDERPSRTVLVRSMAVFAPDPALHFTDAAGGYGDMSAVVLCCSSSSSSSSSTSSSSSSPSSSSSDRHHVSASSSTLRSRCSLSSPSGRHYHARDHGQDGDLLCKQLRDVVVDVAEHVGWQQDRVHELCVIPVPPTGVRSRLSWK